LSKGTLDRSSNVNEFVIHSIPGSPFGRSILVALEEKGARYRLAPVAPGSLRTPAHLALHPFGRVPVMDHGSFRLYESQAILRYLDRVLPQPPLTPSDPQATGRMDQLMNVNDWYLFQGAANVIVFQRIVGPLLMDLTPDEEAIARAMPKAHAAFAELERQLSGSPFFAGESLSLADVLLAPQLDFFRATPEWEPLAAKTPNLRVWLDSMNARPSMVATTMERVAAMANAD
jgi:glutathione S-transferase